MPLLPRFLIQSELERGELMLASKLPLQESAGYYLVALVENQTMARTKTEIMLSNGSRCAEERAAE